MYDKLNIYKQKSESEISAFSLFLYETVFEMKPRAVLEIGVNRGGVSTHTILGAMHDLQQKDSLYKTDLYSVDIKDFSSTISKDNPIRKNWTFIKANSLTYKFERVVDILLIDGGHEFNEVKSDYDNYVPLVRKGGYVLIHDTIWCPGVNKFWNSNYIQYPKIELNWQNGLGVISKI